ncbi:YdgA family protein [Bordetella sp. LUAb4]|uniref:YdgA family protein n=1 Tax=Bordetella sp. LUAb4 TaxID=2843195 RepID=UPI001E3D83A9|nr:DUF945 family protein [Bordetella sp. LUAb4]
MKRTSGLLIFLLLSGVGWVEVSWYIGKRAQRATVAWVEDANQRLREFLPGIPLVIETESYDRGLFSSHARYVLQWRPVTAPGVLLPPGGSYAVAWANVAIEHGPYPLRPAGSLDGKPGARGGSLFTASRVAVDIKGAPALSAALGLPQPVALAAIDARVDYNGGADVQWRMPPWRAAAQGSHVNWHGATGTGRVERDGALRMSASAEGLTMSATDDAASASATANAAATTAITGLALTLDLSASDYALSPGTASLAIKRWRDTYTDDRGKAQPWEATDLHWQTKVGSDEGGLDLAIEYKLGGLRAGKDELGQGSGQVRLSHLDGAALTQAWQDLRLLTSALVLGQVSPTALSAIVADLSRAGMTMLGHQPRVALRALTWQSPRDGTATLDSTLQLGPTPQRTLNIDPLWTVLDMVRGFDLKARVPDAMLRDFPRLHKWVRQTGFFVNEGADLVAAIQTDDDRASVNGKAMSTVQWLTRYAGPRPPTIALPKIDLPTGPPLLGLPDNLLQPDLLTPDMLPPDLLSPGIATPRFPAAPPPSSLAPPRMVPQRAPGHGGGVGDDAHASDEVDESDQNATDLQDAAADATDMADTTVAADAVEAADADWATDAVQAGDAADAATDAAIDVARPRR